VPLRSRSCPELAEAVADQVQPELEFVGTVGAGLQNVLPRCCVERRVSSKRPASHVRRGLSRPSLLSQALSNSAVV
jgi:hypothetical protein